MFQKSKGHVLLEALGTLAFASIVVASSTGTIVFDTSKQSIRAEGSRLLGLLRELEATARLFSEETSLTILANGYVANSIGTHRAYELDADLTISAPIETTRFYPSGVATPNRFSIDSSDNYSCQIVLSLRGRLTMRCYG